MIFGNFTGRARLLSLRYIIFLLLPVIILSSCSPVRTIPVEIALLPQQRIPDTIQSLTLVNRAANNRYSNFRADSLQQFFFQRQFRMDTVLYDTKSTDTLLVALGDILFESGRFDIVIPENRFLSTGTYSSLPTTMSWEEVDTLTRIYNTDAVLSLDFFRTQIKTSFDREALYDQQSNQFFTGYFATMDIAYEALFRIYNPIQRNIISNLAIIDTLRWEDGDTEIRPLFNRFTTVKAGLMEAGIHAAIRLSERIAPDWRITNRHYFFKGHPLLEQAHLQILEGNWYEAADIWHRLEEMPLSRSLKSKVEFNLALAYEMFGNLDTALKWGLQSYDTMYRPLTYNYLERLNVRKQQISGK